MLDLNSVEHINHKELSCIWAVGRGECSVRLQQSFNRQDSENTTTKHLQSYYNPINVNQSGITVLFLFDVV